MPVNVMPLAGGQVVSTLLIFKSLVGRKKGIMGHRKDREVKTCAGPVLCVVSDGRVTS